MDLCWETKHALLLKSDKRNTETAMSVSDQSVFTLDAVSGVCLVLLHKINFMLTVTSMQKMSVMT